MRRGDRARTMTGLELPDLPVRAAIPALLAALDQARRAVLVAPPGAGKTTLVPLALKAAGRLGGGRILLLEPRRLAARAAARRMAELLGEQVGATVGYVMRMDRRVSAETRILVVTEGVLSRDDPRRSGAQRRLGRRLRRVSRALARWRFRPGAGARRASRLASGPAAAGDVGHARRSPGGRTARRCARHRECRPGLPGRLALPGAAASHADRGGDGRRHRRGSGRGGGQLARLPARAAARSSAPPSAWRAGSTPMVEVLPLYGQLDGRAQDAAIRPAAAGRRKVVLATSIAETSITIDGVRVVIDSGLSRLPRFEPATGITRLETVRVSRASADQRAGRAGRTAAGRGDPALARGADRCAAGRSPRRRSWRPISSGLVLDCAAFGVGDPLEPRVPRSAACAGACRSASAAGARSPRSIPTAASLSTAQRCAGWPCPYDWRTWSRKGPSWALLFKPRSSPCC